jgi:hypothetical protein
MLRWPTVSHEEPFLSLPLPVMPQRIDDGRRDAENPDLAPGLGRDEPDRAFIEIDVEPSQRPDFTWSSPCAKHDVKRRLEPLARRGPQEQGRLIAREGAGVPGLFCIGWEFSVSGDVHDQDSVSATVVEDLGEE